MTKPDLIAEAITEAFGERCKEFAIGCPCCEVWREYDALRAKPDKNGWRPIETAPKDGTGFLGWISYGSGTPFISTVYFQGGGWRTPVSDNAYTAIRTPIAWMPFPRAPKPPVTP